MKINRLKFVVLIVFIACMLLPLGQATEAAGGENAFYMVTQTCPDGYFQHIEDHYWEIVANVITWNPEITGISSLEIGMPFSFMNADAQIYYFPIIYEGSIVYYYRMYLTESGYTGVLSNFLVKELSAYEGATSREQPLTLYERDGAIVALFAREETILFEMPEGLVENTSEALPVEDAGTVNIYDNAFEVTAETESTENLIKAMSYDNVTVPFVSEQKVLFPESILKERQGSLPWCSGYVTTQILRYYGYDVSTEEMANYYGMSIRDAFSWNSLKEFPRRYQLYPKTIYKTISGEAYAREIDKGRPMMLVVNSAAGSHAICGVGYLMSYSDEFQWEVKNGELIATTVSSKYDNYSFIIWNPWYSTFELMDYVKGQSTIYLPFQSSSIFTWSSTLYNYGASPLIVE